MLRVVFGLSLAAHGYPKLFGGPEKQPPALLLKLLGSNFLASVQRSGPQAFSQGLARRDYPFPLPAAYASGLAEFAGGLALTAGALTRVVAPVVLGNMLVATRSHWQTGYIGTGGYELATLYAAAAATLALTGPGDYSVDRLLSGSR